MTFACRARSRKTSTEVQGVLGMEDFWGISIYDDGISTVSTVSTLSTLSIYLSIPWSYWIQPIHYGPFISNTSKIHNISPGFRRNPGCMTLDDHPYGESQDVPSFDHGKYHSWILAVKKTCFSWWMYILPLIATDSSTKVLLKYLNQGPS